LHEDVGSMCMIEILTTGHSTQTFKDPLVLKMVEWEGGQYLSYWSIFSCDVKMHGLVEKKGILIKLSITKITLNSNNFCFVDKNCNLSS
jgi:hypothetical protein